MIINNKQGHKGINTGVYLNEADYRNLLELQAQLQLTEKRRVTISEVIRRSLRAYRSQTETVT